MTTRSAPGKIILAGEHAVVYGRPAIAAPVWQVTATATVQNASPGSGCNLIAPDLGQTLALRDAPADHPLALACRLALAQLDVPADPDWTITVRSEIPIAGGLGSGAALSTALVRAITAHAGHELPPAAVSAIVFESERFYHGTPSGIDNTVIAWGTPIWFVKGEAPQGFAPGARLTLLIADSGIRSPTHETVGDVRRAREREPARYEAIFDAMAEVAYAVRAAIEHGNLVALGVLFNRNHNLLGQIGVSSPALERLITSARAAGALGAKLSGGGRGGNIFALVTPERAERVRTALLAAGAVRVLGTVLDAETTETTEP